MKAKKQFKKPSISIKPMHAQNILGASDSTPSTPTGVTKTSAEGLGTPTTFDW